MRNGLRFIEKILRTNCVQPVTTPMNNQWGEHPQYSHDLWKTIDSSKVIPPSLTFIPQNAHQLHTELCAPKIRDITDKTPYFSPLSTLPITTTTIYI